MKEIEVKILELIKLNDTINIVRVERPENYIFIPGQAVGISMKKNNLIQTKRIFTFTGLPEWNFLEFIIKTNNKGTGLAAELNTLNTGDKLFLSDKICSINYQGAGTFIAGGLGITPFISIFRFLKSKKKLEGNRLILSIKNIKDLILYDEFYQMLGNNFQTILTEEKNCDYSYGRLNEQFLEKQIKRRDRYFYVCGSNNFVINIKSMLLNLGIFPYCIEPCN
jgi:ferredoxin-NADP reductase